MSVIRAVLERGQHVRMTANGSSMLPFIHNGDVVELEPIRSSLTIGDIVLTQISAERYVLHRIVQVKEDIFFLRSDAQEHSEGPLTLCNVLGKE